MTDLSRSDSSVVMTMSVTSTPSTQLALTNFAYCSASDLRHFSVPGTTDLFLATVANVFVLSLSYPFNLIIITSSSSSYTYLFRFYY
ncbi:unnamed protein product [Cochlearia groenlandica]